MSKYKVGNIVTGSITGIEKYGVFVSLDDYYSGLIHISEISDGFVSDINNYVKLGESIRAKIIEVDDESCHVKLSIKGIKRDEIKKKKMGIISVGSGFGILRDNLDNWMSNKIKENDKKQQKNS